MNIEDIVLEKKVYIVNGNKFNSKEEAERYVLMMNHIVYEKKYYRVYTELNKEGIYTKELLISIESDSDDLSLNILFEYLINKFGNPVTRISDKIVNTYSIKGPLKLDELEDSLVNGVIQRELELADFKLKDKSIPVKEDLKEVAYINLNFFGRDLFRPKYLQY